MTGILIPNGDRPDILFDDGTLYGGLHCGDCFQLSDCDAQWHPVRLEYTDDWVLTWDNQVFPLPYGYKVML